MMKIQPLQIENTQLNHNEFNDYSYPQYNDKVIPMRIFCASTKKIVLL